MSTRIVRIVGIVLFAAAFFMPAITFPGADPDPMTGWMCAVVAGASTASIFYSGASLVREDPAGTVCLILSGWVNPLMLMHLMFSIWRKFVRIRRVLAAAILICFVATWFFFFKAPMTPLIGHFVWVAGALMILAAEVVGR
jgi:hypothetical protein